MKKIFIIPIILLVLLTSFSCSSAAPPAADKTVRIAMSTEPDSLNFYKSAASDTEAMMMNVHRGLVFFDSTGKIIPSVAKIWKISDDGLTYTFELNKGVKFHDGSELTSKDVVYSYSRLSGLDGSEPNSKYEIIESVTEDGDYGAVIKLHSADASFLSRCKIALFPKDYEDQDTKPIGCGPFKFVDYSPTQNLRLERFDDYFDKADFPAVKYAEFIFIPDSNAQLLALQTGTVDITNVPFENLVQLDDNEFTKLNYTTNTVQGLFMNLSVKPFDNLAVRRAISHAIDVQAIIDITTDGRGIPSSTLLSPAMTEWYDKTTANPYPYDPEKAKALLSEAGYASGFEFTIMVPSNYEPHVKAAQIIADQLSKVGIKANIKLIEWAQWLSDVYGKSEFEATVSGFTGKLDPYDVFIRYKSDYSRNFFKYASAEYDALLNQTMTENDQSARAETFKRIQRKLVDDAVSVCIQDVAWVYGMNKKVTGLVIYPITFYDLTKVDIAE